MHHIQIMNPNLTLSSIRDKGYKITDVRREIVGLFSEAEKPLSAGELYEKLHSKNLKVNKTTVYREINFLLKKCYLSEVYLKPHEKSYESAELIHHHHLICESCGKIDNVTNCLANELEENVLKNKGFRITRHSLEFYGKCRDCIKNYNNGKK